MEMSLNVLSRSNELAEAKGARIGIPALVMLRLLYADVLARLRRTEERLVGLSISVLNNVFKLL